MIGVVPRSFVEQREAFLAVSSETGRAACRCRMIMQNRFNSRVAVLAVAILFAFGCGREPDRQQAGRANSETSFGVLRLATTTSTRDSGLLDELLPVFEKDRNCRVDVVAVGTGAALKLGEAGDADVLLVHAREAEEAFMQAGHGIRHEEFMYNEFTILGPSDDPARIRGDGPIDALKKIAGGKHRFISRGDNSGTHQRELALWKQAGGRPSWDAYIECGQGMGPALVMADELRAYVLTDLGTFSNFRDKIGLVPLSATSENLRNPYAVIVVNPAKHENTNERLADAFAEFLISAKAQRLIEEYQLAGRPLFYPTRLTSGD